MINLMSTIAPSKLNENQLLEKYGTDKTHMQTVSELSCLIFDKLNNKLFMFNDKHREFLRIGALLHDICASDEKDKNHNKSACQIIKDNLDKYNKEECIIIANIARYHRGPLPDKLKHKDYSACEKNQQRLIKKLGAIVKIADGLDCLHNSTVKDIEIRMDKSYKVIFFYVRTKDESLDFRDFKCLLNKKDLFEYAFKMQTSFYIN